MRDLALIATTGDLALSGGQLSLTASTAAVQQKLAVRLRLSLGEWFLDTSAGVPYLQQILGQKGKIEATRATLLSCVSTCPGVAEVLSFDFNVDTRTRQATLNVVARATTGEIVTVEDFHPGQVL